MYGHEIDRSKVATDPQTITLSKGQIFFGGVERLQ